MSIRTPLRFARASVPPSHSAKQRALARAPVSVPASVQHLIAVPRLAAFPKTWFVEAQRFCPSPPRIVTDSNAISGTSTFTPERVAVHVNAATERALKRGQLWLFQEGVVRVRAEGKSGDIAVVYDTKNRPFALGIYDPTSPIRVRVLHVGVGVQIDAAWMTQKVVDAAMRRQAWFTDATDGYRIVHGPGDGLPGLVADRYADTVVIKLYSAAWIPWLSAIRDALVAQLQPERVVLRLNRQLQSAPELCDGYTEGDVIYGPPLQGVLAFRENGVVFECDPILGQKTGFFLDQRENRERVERLSKGKRVLNVFSYTGGFSLYAARGGATVVVSVDASRPAMDALERNVALNAADPRIAQARYRNLCGDAFEIFSALNAANERFDVLIVDPPSFARKAAEVDGALRAYRRLARLAAPLAAPEAVVVFASCSSRVTPEAFRQTIQEGVNEAGFYLEVFGEEGHPYDHPIASGELQYLKCLFATLSPRRKSQARPARPMARSGRNERR